MAELQGNEADEHGRQQQRRSPQGGQPDPTEASPIPMTLMSEVAWPRQMPPPAAGGQAAGSMSGGEPPTSYPTVGAVGGPRVTDPRLAGSRVTGPRVAGPPPVIAGPPPTIRSEVYRPEAYQPDRSRPVGPAGHAGPPAPTAPPVYRASGLVQGTTLGGPVGAGVAPTAQVAEAGDPHPVEAEHGMVEGAAEAAVEAAEVVGRAAMASAGFVQTHASRAMSRNLRTVLPTAAEWPVLDRRGVKEMTVRQFLVWRRSWLYFLLPAAIVSGVIHLVWLFFDDSTNLSKELTKTGTVVLVGTQLVQTLGYPVATALAVHWWARQRASRWALAAGWAASFLLPFAVAMIPFHYFAKSFGVEQAEAFGGAALATELDVGEQFIYGLAGAAFYLVTVVPIVLSIIPGVLRACVRIKSVLPESIVPGWFLVLAAPMYAMVLMLAFIAVNQVAGNLLLIVGVLLLMAAPAAYLWKASLFIRPVAGQLERRQLVGIQGVYAAVVALGLAAILLYVLTVRFGGRPVVGNTSPTVEIHHRAFLSVGTVLWEAIKFVIGYTARSMYITAVAVDLFMLVNLSVWRNTKAFAATAEAYAYDQIMADFEATAEAR